MTNDVDPHDALATLSNDYEVRRELHAVPPHAVYEVTVGGTRAVCKVARGPRADPATEAGVMAFAGRETAVPVPRILGVGDDWFVAEWRDGLPDEEPTVDADRTRTLGAGLATLHEETAGAFDRTGFPRAESGVAGQDPELAVDARESWTDTVCDLLTDRRDYLAEFGYAEVAEAARSVLRDHPEVLANAGEPVLAHGNYLPDHVALPDSVAVADNAEAGDAGPTCVVDWEHALVAPAEYDYWRTATPLFGGPGGPGETEREAFRAGYESVRALPPGFEDRAPAYRLVDAVSYLESLHLQRQQTGQEKARSAVTFRRLALHAVDELRRDATGS